LDTKFYYILIGWGTFFTLLATICGIIRLVLHCRQPVYFLMHNARLVRAVVIIAQIIALPFGATAFKVSHYFSENAYE
jgi:hypothetical protein